jgi:predicted porin
VSEEHEGAGEERARTGGSTAQEGATLMDEDPESQRRAGIEEVQEAAAEDESTPVDDDASARQEEASLNEDPEAQRRTRIEEEPELRIEWPTFDIYGSVRIHAIKNFEVESESTELNFGDGASRVGIRGEWQMAGKWWVFGRAEGGFDVLETFTPKAGEEKDGGLGLRERLLYLGLDSDNLTATYGKNWSAYYKIAGMADRFSIFGGSAAGVYNAGTDGGQTGTGRADDVLQARIYTSSLKALRIKPFNLNVQFQSGQPIPKVENRKYADAFGASAWLESQGDRGMGLAWHRSRIDNPEDPLIQQAGIDGDAQALAMAFRSYGERWYAALVISWLENVETTDEFKYFDGRGAELYVQWQFRDRWWMIAGGNWLKPDDDDPEAGEYEVQYGVLGLRYTFDSFRRMLYAEYRIDNGTLANGNPKRDELTLGFRWDFGY